MIAEKIVGCPPRVPVDFIEQPAEIRAESLLTSAI